MRSGLNEKGQPTRACLQCLELPSPRPPNRLATASHLTPPCFLTDSSTMTQREGLSLAYPTAFTNFLQLPSFRPDRKCRQARDTFAARPKFQKPKLDPQRNAGNRRTMHGERPSR